MDYISKGTYNGYSNESKLNTLYDCLIDTHKQIKELNEKLDRKKKWDRGASFFGGMVGAIAMLLSKWFLWRQ